MPATVGSIPVVAPATGVPGRAQGHWTYTAYRALPDDGRHYEVLHGVLIVTPSPSFQHQEAVWRIGALLREAINERGLGVVISDFDTVLGTKDVVRPDLVVVLEPLRDRLSDRRVLGAPDLVVEVASPGSSTYDRGDKRATYAKAGVREYWIADPASQTIEVLALDPGQRQYRTVGLFSGEGTITSTLIKRLKTPVRALFA